MPRKLKPIYKEKREVMNRDEAKEINVDWVNDEFPMISQSDFEERVDKIYDNCEKHIGELEHKLALILDNATGGCISKPYTN